MDGWECGRRNVCHQREEATGRAPDKRRLRCLWDGVGLRTRYVHTERWTRTSMGAEDCRADERAGPETLLWPLNWSFHPLRRNSLGHGASFTELKVSLGWWDLS